MRVSVTLTDEMNKSITAHANKAGVSKDKFIGSLVEKYLNDIDLPREYYKATAENNLKAIRDLSEENKKLKEELDKLKAHNARGAGRKSKFSEIEIYEMKDYKDQGYTYGQIADIFKCSVGLVHKLINE